MINFRVCAHCVKALAITYVKRPDGVSIYLCRDCLPVAPLTGTPALSHTRSLYGECALLSTPTGGGRVAPHPMLEYLERSLR